MSGSRSELTAIQAQEKEVGELLEVAQAEAAQVGGELASARASIAAEEAKEEELLASHQILELEKERLAAQLAGVLSQVDGLQHQVRKLNKMREDRKMLLEDLAAAEGRSVA